MKRGIGQYVKRRNYYLDSKNALNIFIVKNGFNPKVKALNAYFLIYIAAFKKDNFPADDADFRRISGVDCNTVFELADF
jgi:hypothetical protein